MEGLATAAAAPSHCCQIILITPVLSHTHTTREPPHFFPDGPPQRNRQHIKRSGRAERAKRGNSKLENVKLRELFVGFLFVQDGLLHAAGIPRANFVWANSRSDKCRPVAQNDLSHFTDGQVEALVSIRIACWERRREGPPALLLLPTSMGPWAVS